MIKLGEEEIREAMIFSDSSFVAEMLDELADWDSLDDIFTSDANTGSDWFASE